MVSVVTNKEVKGFTPSRIFTQKIGKSVIEVRMLYVFTDDIPSEFVEACNDNV